MLDLKKLRQIDEDLASKTKSANSLFNVAKITGETAIRIMPPLPEMNGIYFVEEMGYWIEGERYVSSESITHEPVLSNIVSAAYKNPDLKSLVSQNKDFSTRSTFLIPGCVLEEKIDKKTGDVKSFTVLDNEIKLIQVPVTVIRQINKIASSRNYQNGTKDGMFDLKKGFNIYITKTGSKLDTEYFVQGALTTSVFDKEVTSVLNPVEYIKSRITEDDELIRVMEVYLYGEEQEKSKPTKSKTKLSKEGTKTPVKSAAKSRSLLLKMNEEE